MYLTLFDLDHTLLAGDSDHMWGQFLIDEGVVDPEHHARENDRIYAQYKAGNLDIHAFQRFSLNPLVDNPRARMHALRDRFMQTRIPPAVARHAAALIAHHRVAGDELAIITATNRFVTEPIAALLGIDHLIATEPEVIDGRYTGAITGIPCYQHGKVERLAEWLERQPQRFARTRFYSDSHNDLPLLRRADEPIAVDPDATLAEAAREAGWPIISLRGEAPPFEFESA